MPDSLKQIKNRIRSVENTRKVTHAMEMVSTAKLRAVENRLPALKEYSSKIEGLLKALLPLVSASADSLLSENKGNGKAALCVITSDNGLCGSYNHNILRLAEDFIAKRGAENTLLVAVGRKGANYFRKRGLPLREKFIELNGRYSDEVSGKILNTLTGFYRSHEADECYLAYARYESLSRVRPVVEKLLRIELPAGPSVEEYILEPDSATLINGLLPLYLSYRMKTAVLNSFAAEHASRMMAMGEATNNAGELLDELVLSRNKMRQAGITKEIMEIVSCAESLR